MEPRKRGRPKTGDAMQDRIFVRISPETKEKLRKCREKLNLSTSDIVRQGIDRIYGELK